MGREVLDFGTQELDFEFGKEVTPDLHVLRTCMQCGTCSASCPTAYAMDYTPRQLWKLVQMGLKEEVVNSRTFWLCTTCKACAVRCPRGIDLTETMLMLKSYAVREGLEIPEGIGVLRDTVTTNYNISGDENETRLIWAENLEHMPRGIEAQKGAEVLYFVGCVSAFYPQAYSIPQAMVQIMEAADVDFTTMGGEEWCCGYPLYSAGMKDLVFELASHNVERIRELRCTKLVATCPSCYYAWTHVYPELKELPPELEVLHATEYLSQLIEQSEIQLGPVERVVTYHDPCDLGRKSGVYDAPRAILNAIPGLEFREMATHGEDAMCCGGGGDVEISDREVTSQVGVLRMEQAQETGAEAVVSACQQCKRTLLTGARQAKIRMRAFDVSELVLESIGNVEG
ncbi:MAG: 4Fe-4S dicluster domain-containing protein [Anaerolineae bacterium]|nr:4Fe-4S dicluster domain-containing protein [Anaerolineae bacterium]NIN99329.1 4Fe-4S dicluster domain-containing protein [Anaerolineae bacterium]NIQ82194.1 4Fe-4S dicluster domain-containing protein [Anaerolineae bacterium]